MLTVQSKYLDVLRVVASWRLCPNFWRGLILARLGWKAGEESAVLWGIIPTTRNVRIGRGSLVGHHAFFDGQGEVIIGDHVRIGSFVKILTTTHPIAPAERRRSLKGDLNLTTRIGRGSWLGAGVMVLPGVNIERGCVIAAGAVVAKDTMPNGLYGGVPASLIRMLPVE